MSVRTFPHYNELLAIYGESAVARDGTQIARRLKDLAGHLSDDTSDPEWTVLRRYARLCELALESRGIEAQFEIPVQVANSASLGPQDPDALAHRMQRLSETGEPGISLVTCAMNRSENLLKALPSWLAQDAIREIVIIDWSSREPVAKALAEAGFDDPRIVVARIEDEGRWILSYAFNLGFRLSRCAQILKVDADIVLSPDFLDRNAPAPDGFIAGNWRKAAADQAFINGFFFVPRRALAEVGGFNEYITTYGWDDDDLYDRLILAGYRRIDVAPGTVSHLSHSDAERSDTHTHEGETATLLDRFTAGTRFLIRRNRYVAALMPPWSSDRLILPFIVVSTGPGHLVLRREGWVPNTVPDHVMNTARHHALADFLAWETGPRAYQLPPGALERVLARPVGPISKLDIEVALADPDAAPRDDRPYMVIAAEPDMPETSIVSLAERARDLGLQPVLRGPVPGGSALPVAIPAHEDIGHLRDIAPSALTERAELPEGNLHLALDDPAPATPPDVPAIAPSRPRLFIDAQHGLGNRLRAVGSAAAIARALDRELVIVWHPDDHCDCRMADLFEYDGALIEDSFVNDARSRGMIVHNYMALEPGGQKDTPVTDTDGDIYARSAFVLQSPHSTWTTENAFLRTLTPVAEVCDLVDKVRHPNDLSVHVRMEGGRKDAHLSYESEQNWSPEDHDLIDHWRGRSHYSHFMKRIDTLVAEDGVSRIFLAADLPETYDAFTATYGDRVACLKRDLYDRSVGQLRYALADALLLGRAPRLLGSTWSSFSELALRLSPRSMQVEMSGKDF